MEITILTEENYSTSYWSGGTTTQMFIYPTDSQYTKQNFSFRISSAEVNETKTVFSLLPDVIRYISPLQNPFALTHNNGKSTRAVSLAPFQIDCFDGGDRTECCGCGKDFNLMLKNASGELTYEKTVDLDGLLFAFVFADKPTEVTVDDKLILLKKNQLLMIKNASKQSLSLNEKRLIAKIYKIQ